MKYKKIFFYCCRIHSSAFSVYLYQNAHFWAFCEFFSQPSQLQFI